MERGEMKISFQELAVCVRYAAEINAAIGGSADAESVKQWLMLLDDASFAEFTLKIQRLAENVAFIGRRLNIEVTK